MTIDLIDLELRYVKASFEFDPQSKKIINSGVYLYLFINLSINFLLTP